MNQCTASPQETIGEKIDDSSTDGPFLQIEMEIHTKIKIKFDILFECKTVFLITLSPI